VLEQQMALSLAAGTPFMARSHRDQLCACTPWNGLFIDHSSIDNLIYLLFFNEDEGNSRC
jgi:hypothetical protein